MGCNAEVKYTQSLCVHVRTGITIITVELQMMLENKLELSQRRVKSEHQLQQTIIVEDEAAEFACPHLSECSPHRCHGPAREVAGGKSGSI